MFKKIRVILVALILLGLFATALFYGALTISLPTLSGNTVSSVISKPTLLRRDELGTAIVHAENRLDASYALGYAHGQDRFFQMDLLRRNAAGELAELFGAAALPLDEKVRFHQLRKRSQKMLAAFPEQQKEMLSVYAKGVNDALAHASFPTFEYLLTQSKRKPWKPEDSLLVVYSMYLDLQGLSIDRDLVYHAIQQTFGANTLAFLTQTSEFQAALDGSRLPLKKVSIPELDSIFLKTAMVKPIEKNAEVGSNNWAVSGALTRNGKAMLSDDMHLMLSTPVIWYRAQLNIINDEKQTQVTGVSLPGVPAIVVGSNNKVAWGFTNSYIDTADWIKLSDKDKTALDAESIPLPNGEKTFYVEVSHFGPVRRIDNEKYALTWVGYQDYAINLNLMNLEVANSVSDALAVSKKIGIPAQNMVVTDSRGDIAWQITGAVPDRRKPSDVPVSSSRFDDAWLQQARDLPSRVNPKDQRIWTANSRAVSASQHRRFGDGGYALGARSEQIKARLFEKNVFDIDDFYQIQLDNEALFLTRWQGFLLGVLKTDPDLFSEDIKEIEGWQGCACADSVGYSLVKRYRDTLIDQLFAPIESQLAAQNLSLALIERQLEPALWQLVQAQADSWKPLGTANWNVFFTTTYIDMRAQLMVDMTGHETGSLKALRWGDVNRLQIQHPFSQQIPVLSNLLNMPDVEGFGDRFMPAVQGKHFGASQRLIVQPGDEVNGVLTLPGGQSGHPLSPFYRSGFGEYANQESTPFLPGSVLHQIEFIPTSP
ncbi:hydrolase [Enterovibrio norvegicus]|uniref:penicillin acylase family protein n=1 Tax=Enterovibrio norvegicus TaxID=188144 RepID=UPI000C84EF97|nr:penicillin acylase family protein [Enterovibrio norvegicus]MCC4797238.1 penicillin acylase family protein [Enterovibrio norvegicus]PMH72450.1 hydrolase [Enterovibrio norvegicus]PMI26967.1 hydrolase [Enterovibrio norvegicus]PMI40086.1 hydrolase [Enterovibrio norvegicus]PMN56155.1 hydrolase [Enterovibrio norvegicus]